MLKPIEENFSPYAPVSAVLDVIKRYRERGMPDPITDEILTQVGIPTTMAGLTLRALLFLGLIDEGGNHTESFDLVRRALTEEYPKVLGEIIRKAYLPIFTIVDPAQDSDTAIVDAFRRYDPANQRQKMVRLFIGLCQEAKIIARTTKRLNIPNKSESSKQKRTEKNNFSEKEDNQDSGELVIKKNDKGVDYRLISAVIQHLPQEGEWTPEERKRWIEAMTASVDLIVRIKEDSKAIITTQQ